jgi:DNA-binding transcriptional LysR family regulator
VGLAFLTTLGVAAVPRLLRDFRVSHPDVRFDLMQGPHALLLDRLRAGDADLALTSPLPDEPGLLAEPLDDEELRLAVPADHPLAARPEGVALAEAARDPFIGFRRGFGMRGTVDAWCREAGFVPRLAFEGGDAETLRGLVGAGLGVALLPVAAHPATPGVVELPVTTPRTTRPPAHPAGAGTAGLPAQQAAAPPDADAVEGERSQATSCRGRGSAATPAGERRAVNCTRRRSVKPMCS